MALYVKFAEEKKPENIRDFLREFYKKVVMNVCYGEVTYHNKECTEQQCSRAHRSYDDLAELLKTYFPELTDKDIIHYLLSTKIDNFKPQLAVCDSMGRIRYIPYQFMNSNEYLNHKMSLSKYTWAELLAMINVKPDWQEVKNYFEKHAE